MSEEYTSNIDTVIQELTNAVKSSRGFHSDRMDDYEDQLYDLSGKIESQLEHLLNINEALTTVNTTVDTSKNNFDIGWYFRLVEELNDLEGKIKRLDIFLKSPKFKELDEDHQLYLNQQLYYMCGYRSELHKRKSHSEYEIGHEKIVAERERMKVSECDGLAHLREARAHLKKYENSSRELSIVFTKIEEAIMWRQNDMQIKAEPINLCNG